MKQSCKNGFDIKTVDVSKIFLIETATIVRSLSIQPKSNEKIDIRILRKRQFDQLSELVLSNVTVINDAENLLCDHKFNSTLKSLSIHHNQNNNINALIHQFPLHVLETLNLSYNSIPNQLNRFFFLNMTNLQTINLSNCQLQFFPSDTFYFVRNTIKAIDLRANHLIRLPSGFSSTFPQPRFNQLTIELDNNPWLCNCDANQFISAKMICLEDCKISITGRSVREQTESDELIELQCEDLSDSEKTETVYLKKQTHNITIEPKSELMLSITVEGPPNAYLIWYNDSFAFNMDNDQNIAEYMHCNDRPNFELPVSQNSTYTFCVLTSSENDQISPFNCVAYYVNPKSNSSIDPELVWITNSDKGKVFGIVITFIVLLMFCGIFLGIFLIRKYPNLLKESSPPYLIDNSNQFSKRNSCTSSSVFSVEDNNTMEYM